MKPYKQFVENLRESDKTVQRFIERQRKHGWDITKNDLRIAPSPEQYSEFTDNGDMIITARIEHKHRKDLTFINRATYKHPTVFVDEVYKVDRHASLPLMYVIENAARTHAAVVYAWTRKEWKRANRYDKSMGKKCWFYEIDKNLVRFCKVENVLGENA